MTTLRIIGLFAAAALAEIGGGWLVWRGIREHAGIGWIGLGVLALGAYGVIAALQPEANFGRVYAAYGGVFVAASLAWGIAVDKFQPDKWDWIGAGLALAGAGVIIFAPR